MIIQAFFQKHVRVDTGYRNDEHEQIYERKYGQPASMAGDVFGVLTGCPLTPHEPDQGTGLED
jgi:hypothetical protein